MIVLKHIISIARNTGLLPFNPFAGYINSPENVDRGFLTKDELNSLVNAKMKNGTISEQLNMQEREIRQENVQRRYNQQNTISFEREKKQTVSPTDSGLSSVLGILTPDPCNTNEEQNVKHPKKKKEARTRVKKISKN